MYLLCFSGLIGKQCSQTLEQFRPRYAIKLMTNHTHKKTLFMNRDDNTSFIIYYCIQFRIPRSELNRLSAAETEEQQRRLLEAFAKDLPILNRFVFIYITIVRH